MPAGPAEDREDTPLIFPTSTTSGAYLGSAKPSCTRSSPQLLAGRSPRCLEPQHIPVALPGRSQGMGSRWDIAQEERPTYTLLFQKTRLASLTSPPRRRSSLPQTFLGCLLEFFNEATSLGMEVPPGEG